jgi:hypothetical protein
VAEADNLEDVKGHRGQGAYNIFSALGTRSARFAYDCTKDIKTFLILLLVPFGLHFVLLPNR